MTDSFAYAKVVVHTLRSSTPAHAGTQQPSAKSGAAPCVEGLLKLQHLVWTQPQDSRTPAVVSSSTARTTATSYLTGAETSAMRNPGSANVAGKC